MLSVGEMLGNNDWVSKGKEVDAKVGLFVGTTKIVDIAFLLGGIIEKRKRERRIYY